MPDKRSDGMPRRFFKSHEMRRTTAIYDQIRQEEQAKHQRELDVLARENALKEHYGLTPVRMSDGYRIEKNGVTLDMDFRNLQATEDAMRVIAYIIRLYNQEFRTERPHFYADMGNLKIDNRPLFDTTYLKGHNGNFDAFLSPGQEASHEMPKLADFLNAILQTQQ